MASNAVLKEDEDDAVVDTVDDKKQKEQEPEVEVVEDIVKREPEKDERLDVTGAADEDDEDRQERKHETAKERRQRAKIARDRDRKELEFQRLLIQDLERKLSNVSNQSTNTQVLTLQQQLQQARDEEARFAQVSSAAQAANNVTDAFAAERIRDDASRRAAQLENNLRAIAQQRNQPPPAPPPAFIPYAKAFQDGKPWYDPNGRNEDSAIVQALDKILANEPGMNPNTPEYWQELEKRVAKRLPQRYKKNQEQDDDVDLDDDADPEPSRTRRGPPVGGGRSANAPGANQIRLSPERVQAMKDANIWDDPVMRKRMAIRYAEFDKSNKTSARR